MNCRETERLLETFFDGELDGRLMRDAALHITRCPTCERELQARERLHDLLTETLAGELAEIAPGQVWARVEAAMGAESREEDKSFRMAAATSTMRGMLLRPRSGAQGPRASSQARRPQRSRLAASLPLAGISALAASVAALLLITGQEPGKSPAPTAGITSTPVAARSSAVTTVASRERRVTPRTVERSAPGQVQIDSLEYSGKAMALWREPASETTIIWIGDSDPRIAKAAR